MPYDSYAFQASKRQADRDYARSHGQDQWGSGGDSRQRQQPKADPYQAMAAQVAQVKAQAAERKQKEQDDQAKAMAKAQQDQDKEREAAQKRLGQAAEDQYKTSNKFLNEGGYEKQRNSVEGRKMMLQSQIEDDTKAAQPSYFGLVSGDPEAAIRAQEATKQLEEVQAEEATLEAERERRAAEFPRVQQQHNVNEGQRAAKEDLQYVNDNVQVNMPRKSVTDRIEDDMPLAAQTRKRAEAIATQHHAGQALDERLSEREPIINQNPDFAQGYKEGLKKQGVTFSEPQAGPTTEAAERHTALAGPAKPEANQVGLGALGKDQATAVRAASTEYNQYAGPQVIGDIPFDEPRRETLAKSAIATMDDAKLREFVESKGAMWQLEGQVREEKLNAFGVAGIHRAIKNNITAWEDLTPEQKEQKVSRALVGATPEERAAFARTHRDKRIELLTPNLTPEQRALVVADADKISALKSKKGPDAVVLSNGTIDLSPRALSDTETARKALAPLIASGEIDEAEAAQTIKSVEDYNQIMAEGEKQAALESKHFQRWIASKPELTGVAPEAQYEAYKSEHGAWSLPSITESASRFLQGAKQIPQAAVRYVQLEAATNEYFNKGTEAQRIAAGLKLMEAWTDADAELRSNQLQAGNAEYVAGTAEVLGQFGQQYGLAMLAKMVSWIPGAGQVAGNIASGATMGANMGMFAANYRLEAIQEAFTSKQRLHGYESLTQMAEKNPELTQQAWEEGLAAADTAQWLAPAEMVPMEKALTPTYKLFQKTGAKPFVKAFDRFLLNPLAETAQEALSELAMGQIRQGLDAEKATPEGMGIKELSQVFLASFIMGTPISLYHRGAEKAQSRQWHNDISTQRAELDTKSAKLQSIDVKSIARQESEAFNAQVAAAGYSGDAHTDLEKQGWTPERPGDIRQDEPLAILLAKRDRLQSVNLDPLPETQQREIEQALVTIDALVEANPETLNADEIEIMAELGTGMTSRVKARDADVVKAKAALDAVTPLANQEIDPEMMADYNRAAYAYEVAIANRDNAVQVKPDPKTQQEAKKAMPFAREIAALPDQPYDLDGNGKLNGSNARDIGKAIYTLVTTEQLPTGADKLSFATKGKVFGKAADGRTTVTNQDLLKHMESASPLLRNEIEAYEARPLPTPQQKVQGESQAQAQANQPQGDSNAAGNQSTDGGTAKPQQRTFEIVATHQRTGNTVVVAEIKAANRAEANEIYQGTKTYEGKIVDIKRAADGTDVSGTSWLLDIEESTPKAPTSKPAAAQAQTPAATPPALPSKEARDQAIGQIEAKKLAEQIQIDRAKTLAKEKATNPQYRAALAEQARAERALKTDPDNSLAQEAKDRATAIVDAIEATATQGIAEATQAPVTEKDLANLDAAMTRMEPYMEIVEAYFPGGITYETGIESGSTIHFDVPNRALVVNITALDAANLSEVALAAVLREEVIHSVVNRIAPKDGATLKEIREGFSKEFADAVVKAYPTATDTDFQFTHEALRFLLQPNVRIEQKDGKATITWKDAGGEVHSETVQPSLMAKLRAALQELQKFINDLGKAFKTEASKTLYKDLKERVREAIENTAPPQAKPEAKPVTPNVTGQTEEFYSPETGKKVTARLKLVDLATAKSSAGTNLQPRDRERAGYEGEKIAKALNFKPAMSGTLGRTDSGPVFVTADNQILSGHGRTNILKLIFGHEKLKEKANEQRQWLKEYLTKQGMTEEAALVDGMKIPALGAEIVDMGDYAEMGDNALAAFVRDANPGESKMSDTEIAFSDAGDKRVTDILKQLQWDDEGNLIVDKATISTIGALAKHYGPEYINADGTANEAFFNRVRLAMLATILGRKNKGLVNSLIENASEDGLVNFSKALIQQAPMLAQMQETGNDVVEKYVAPAVKEYIQWKKEGGKGTFQEYLQQGDLETGFKDKDFIRIANAIGNAKGTQALADALKEMTLDSEMGSLFSQAVQTLPDLTPEARDGIVRHASTTQNIQDTAFSGRGSNNTTPDAGAANLKSQSADRMLQAARDAEQAARTLGASVQIVTPSDPDYIFILENQSRPIALYQLATRRILVAPSLAPAATNQAAARAYLREEVIHAAQHRAIINEWEADNRGFESPEALMVDRYQSIIDDLESTPAGRGILVRSGRVYRNNASVPHAENAQNAGQILRDYTADAGTTVELVRQLVQLRQDTGLTEESLRRAYNTLRKWFESAVRVLRSAAKQSPSPLLDQAVQDTINILNGRNNSLFSQNGLSQKDGLQSAMGLPLRGGKLVQDGARRVSGPTAETSDFAPLRGEVLASFEAAVQEARPTFKTLGATVSIETAPPSADAQWAGFINAEKRAVFYPSLAPAQSTPEYVRAIVREELIHAAQLAVAERAYQDDPRGAQDGFDYYFRTYGGIVQELAKTRQGREILERSVNAYSGGVYRDAAFSEGKILEALEQNPLRTVELVRQLVQMRQQGQITEGHLRNAYNKLTQWFNRVLQTLRQAAKQSPSPLLDETVQQTIDALNGKGETLRSQPLTPQQVKGLSQQYNELFKAQQEGKKLSPTQLRALDEAERKLGQQLLFAVERTFLPAEELRLEFETEARAPKATEEQLALFSQAITPEVRERRMIRLIGEDAVERIKKIKGANKQLWTNADIERALEPISDALFLKLGMSQPAARRVAALIYEGKPTLLDKIVETKPIRMAELDQHGLYPSKITSLGYELGERKTYTFTNWQKSDEAVPGNGTGTWNSSLRSQALFSQTATPQEAGQMLLSLDFAPKTEAVARPTSLTKEQRKLVEDNMGLAGWAANRYSIRGMSKEDIKQEAAIALSKAAMGYRPESGPFGPYAATAVARRIGTLIKLADRKPLNHSKTLSKPVHEDSQGETAQDQIEGGLGRVKDDNVKTLLAKAIAAIPAKAREIIMRRAQGETWQSMAKEMGVSHQYVQGFAQKASEKLQRDLANVGITSYSDIYPMQEGADRTQYRPGRTEQEDGDNETMLDAREPDAEPEMEDGEGLRSQAVTPAQAETELGRAMPLGTLVQASGGLTTLGQLTIGSAITAPDRTEQTVLGIYPQGIVPVYRIVTESGRDAMATADHLWQTTDSVAQTRDLRVGDLLPVLTQLPQQKTPAE
jgi:RNA polymerase sigma factor (sigma-70 family)